MDNRINEKIIKWFLSDSIELLDLVLSDNHNDPEYSANTAYNRIKLYAEYEASQNNVTARSVEDYLKDWGYSDEDIKLLNELRKEEHVYCP